MINGTIYLTQESNYSDVYNLYSDVDSYTTPFETYVSQEDLIAGYHTTSIPDSTNIVRIQGVGLCTNFASVKISSYSGFTFETTVSGDTAGRTFSVSFQDVGSYDATIFWGDGNSSNITSYNDSNRSHTYSQDGSYDVEIIGTIGSIRFGVDGASNAQKVTDVVYWGDSQLFDGFYEIWGMFDGSNIVSTGSGNVLMNASAGSYTATQLFDDCLYLTSVHSGIFDNLTGVTNFTRTFFGCESLTTVPSGLFDAAASLGLDAFQATFRFCYSLETVPEGLFRNVNVDGDDSFRRTFEDCYKLQLNKYIFYNEGEQSTRFTGTTQDFDLTFNRDTFTGTQGTAPDLWNCSFGALSGTTSCFGGVGNDASSLTNYGSIPSAWGGPA